MLIHSQNAFFETLHRSAQSSTKTKPAGSESGQTSPSSQGTGFAHSPKTSLNQAENSLGKGALKTLFSGGSVYQGLAALAEAKNTGSTAAQPVSATTAFAEGGEIPPIPDPQNVSACVDFIQAHEITVEDVLAFLDDEKNIQQLLQGNSEQNPISFESGHQALYKQLNKQVSPIYYVSTGTGDYSPNPEPDLKDVKNFQIIHSILNNSFALSSTKLSPHEYKNTPPQTWLQREDLTNLETALKAKQSEQPTNNQNKLVSHILNEVQINPESFLKITVQVAPFAKFGINDPKQIQIQCDKEIALFDARLDLNNLNKSIAQTIYRNKDYSNNISSDFFDTPLKPNMSEIEFSNTKISKPEILDINIITRSDITKMIKKNELPSPQLIAQAFNMLPEPLLNNYANRFEHIGWPAKQVLISQHNEFLTTHPLEKGENTRANLQIGLEGDFKEQITQRNLYEMLVHEVGHIVFYKEFNGKEGTWLDAIRKDNFQPAPYGTQVSSNGITRYAQFHPNGQARAAEDKATEDFGETFAIYILSIQNSTPENNLHAQVRAAFPERFAILDQFADKLLTPEQIQQYLPARK